ncbi:MULTISPECIES: LCP family protein [Caproicibacterium]|nr:LCP family protein [Caproicibacterium lactatifermentans]MDD4808015.1 LCP family protein [Oscillospiraceae bacterium]
MSNSPQNGGSRRPPQRDPYTQRRQQDRPPADNRNIYSHSSRRPRTDEPLVDASAYSARRRRANARRTRPTQVRYHDGFDPDDQATTVDRRRSVSPSGSGRHTPYGSTARRKRGGHHIFRNVICILLALLVLSFAWLTALFSNMNRTHNTVSQSTYVRTPEHAPDWKVMSSPLVTNVLLIGMDLASGDVHRSDSLILLSFDHTHNKIKMTSFLRDTYVEIPNHGRQKLNAAFAYGGPALTMQTLENNYRIKIDKYLAVDFDSFSTIISDVGGIDVTLDQGLCIEFNKNLATHFTPGKYNLKGVQALYYTRIRNYGNDYGRAQRQREVIGQLMKKLALSGPFKLTATMNKFLPLVWTNMSASSLAGISITSLPMLLSKQKTQQIPADGTFKGETLRSVGWVEVAQMEKNCRLLRQFIYETNSTS